MHIVITKFSRVNKIYNCLQVYIIYFWHRLSWNYYIWHVLWHRHWRITSYFKNNYLSNGGLLCNFTFKFWNTFSYGRTFYTQASAFSRNYSMVLAESGTSQDFDFEDDDDDEEDDVTVVNHGKLFTYFIMWYKNSVCSAVQVYDLRFRLDIIFDYSFCLHCTLHYSFSIKEKNVFLQAVKRAGVLWTARTAGGRRKRRTRRPLYRLPGRTAISLGTHALACLCWVLVHLRLT